MPLTRHMVMTWHRWGHRDDWQINSIAGRLSYIVWYLTHFMPTRPLESGFDNPEVIRALNAEVLAFRPLTKFWFEVWRKDYKDRVEYDIFREEGFFYFLTEALSISYERKLPLVLFPATLYVGLNERQPGFNGVFFSRCYYNTWKSSEFYREHYSNLNNESTLNAFMFDQLLIFVIEGGRNLYLAPDVERYWTAEVFPGSPCLNRFSLALAGASERFDTRIREGMFDAELAKEASRWLQDEVYPSMPGLERLVPKLAASGGKAIYDHKSMLTTGKLAPRHRDRFAAQSFGVLRKSDRNIDVLVVGPSGASSGLGSGMRRSIGALKRTGASFRVLPAYYDIPSVFTTEAEDGLTYHDETPKIVLWHFNGEYLPEVMTTMPEIVSLGYNIGYFFWETEAMPICHDLACELVDEIWAPSEFCKKTYEGHGAPVVNVGSSVELPNVKPYLTRAELGLPPDVFVVMFSFDSHSVIHRKNPAAVVRAFKKAFPRGDEKAMLVIKTQNMATAHWNEVAGRGEELLELCASDARILFFDRTMTLRELYSLKNACDCYMSLHRSEGYGYGPAEAMAIGKPVIMTGYSANVEFATADNCVLIDGPLIHVEEKEYLYWTPEMKWADPSVSQAAAALRRLFDDRDAALAMGRRAAETINRDHGVEAMGLRYAKRLRELGVTVQKA
jgi:glycosyltransferase involved in cell wall biosynthesis